MTSLAMKPFARSLPVRASRPGVSSHRYANSLAVNPYSAAAARELGLAAAIAGSRPLTGNLSRSLD
jgi:hypothetical protein